MIGTQDLPSGGFPFAPTLQRLDAVLCISGGQILGGAAVMDESLDFDGTLGIYKSPEVLIEDVWGVSDLTVKHWLAAVRDGDASLIFVPHLVQRAARLTLDRYNSAAKQDIKSEVDKRVGVLDAVATMVRAGNPMFGLPMKAP